MHRSAHAFTCLNRYPYNSGHVMVIPRAHVADLGALSRRRSTPTSARSCAGRSRSSRAVYAPDGMNVGMNLGRAAGAGIVDHLHWHVVPRWVGDNNFMPVLADQRVVVEALDEAWERLHAGFAAAP